MKKSDPVRFLITQFSVIDENNGGKPLHSERPYVKTNYKGIFEFEQEQKQKFNKKYPDRPGIKISLCIKQLHSKKTKHPEHITY